MSVSYGPVHALADVSIAFAPGLIHAVVGQNGAGKTTFARAAAGLVKPQSGSLLIGGRQIEAGDVNGSRDAGVELVHQSFALPPSFTVAEAMEFGARNHPAVFTARQLAERWKPHLAALDIQVDVRRRIRDLPVETQQGVEIARALVSDAKVLILDEPTAVLSPSGIEKLFDRVRALKARGVTVILILHKIREVLAVADTISILRGGRLIGAGLPAGQTEAGELARLIIGNDAVAGKAAGSPLDAADAAAIVGAGAMTDATPEEGVALGPARAPLLAMRGVSTHDDGDGPPLAEVSLAIAAGEIVGVAGVEGNGQRTLVRALAGLAELSDGTIELDGASIGRHDLADRRAMGLRIIPFERNSEGLSLSSSLWENWAARQLLGRPLLSAVVPSRMRRDSEVALRSWSVHFNSTTQKAGSLSGGNAQKVIFARELDGAARLILAAQPTRGLDVGATAFVWQSLREARDRGCAILLISSDLDELFDISDRLIVMLSGRLAGEFKPPYEVAEIGAAMTGAGATPSLSQAAAAGARR